MERTITFTQAETDRQYYDVSIRTSRLVTSAYSTSFSIGVRCLDVSTRDAIYSIYGFVRLADEIVDTFHGYDQYALLDEFEQDYYRALECGISLNPVLNAFQHTVRRYGIQDRLVQAFLRSMRSDLHKSEFGDEEIREYIHGSAEVVGLMCLKVFVNGDQSRYDELEPYAIRLGAAFQKINFLRDLRHDTHNLHRVYFPILRSEPLNEHTKQAILEDIFEDYRMALVGIRKLPKCARLGVYTAYLYYLCLTRQIARTRAEELMRQRVRVSNPRKVQLLCKAYLQTRFSS